MQKKVLTISYIEERGYAATPFFRMRGKWMERAGFNIGDKIEVVAGSGRMIIEKIQPTNNEELYS